MLSSKRKYGEILGGVVMFALGLAFLSGARSALLYHTTIYFKGWMYPWQAIIGGSLSAGIGLFLIIHGLCRKKKPSGDS
jgi:putative Mn2+ efflux pump MntP